MIGSPATLETYIGTSIAFCKTSAAELKVFQGGFRFRSDPGDVGQGRYIYIYIYIYINKE